MARPKKLRDAVLRQALKDVADREGTYGDPLTNHQRVATLIHAWLMISDGGPVVPLDSVAIQILTNLARLVETPNHKGSWDNIAGYAAIGYEVTR